MAEYKVPQDVEADDKLIGPFSFRQFIYLIIVALAGAAAWGLAQLFVGLAIIPLPIILLFGALALPLRKDQPMEIYLAAIIAFYLKPHRRLWDPDGLDSLVEITAPKTIDNSPRTKDLSQGEAEQRFGYLANIVDSQGWAIRGVGNSGPLNNDLYLEAQGAQDLLDSNNSIGQSLNSLISQSDDKRREEMVTRMREQAAAPPVPATPPPTQPVAQPLALLAQPIYNPYPTIQQSIVQPLDANRQAIPSQPVPTPTPPVTPAEPTSNPVVSADIMNLATNTDFSIETIAREANRIKDKQDMQDEVVISLR